MIRMLKYASKKFQVTLQDGNGTEIDPTDVKWIKVFIYNQKFVILEKFYYSYTQATPDGFTDATLGETSVSVPLNYIICILNSSVTGKAAPGKYFMQISWAFTDADYENSERISSIKGDFLIIEEAKN